MRDKDTAEDDLKKLIVDFKIILGSRKFGIQGISFHDCLINWADFCRFNLKIPAEVISTSFPSLKDFFYILRDIVTRHEIPQSKRSLFLKFLSDDADLINRAIADQIKILCEKFSFQLKGLSDDDIKKVLSFMPSNSFADLQENFHQILYTKANELRKGLLKTKLLNLWHKIAGSSSPRDWSKNNRTPILAMVPKSEMPNAKKVFDIVMANSPDEKDIQFAISYLEKRPSYFVALKDSIQIEATFRKTFIGKYRGLLDDNDEIRGEIETKFHSNPYTWFQNVTVNEFIANFAEDKYFHGGAYDKVKEKVMSMPDEDAKKILIELLEKNFEVGLKILREY